MRQERRAAARDKALRGKAPAGPKGERKPRRPSYSFNYENFKQGPAFLKMLVGNAAINKLGNYPGLNELAARTGINYRCSSVGEYYPYSEVPRRVCIFAGEPQNVLNAFGEVQEVIASNEAIIFLLPEEASQHLTEERLEQAGMKTKAKLDLVRLWGCGREVALDISGKKEAVREAVKWVLGEQEANFPMESGEYKNCNYVQQEALQTESTIYIPIPEELVGYIVGKQGKRIMEFEEDYRVRLGKDKVHTGPPGTQMWRLTGATGSVHIAHLAVLRILEAVQEKNQKFGRDG